MPIPQDLPPVIVQLHVVKTAEEYPAIDIGSSVICRDMIDVVRFAVRRGSAASRPQAPAVAHRERNPLLRGEEALFVADIQGIPARIDGDVGASVLAERPIDDRARECVAAVFRVAHPHHPPERIPRADRIGDDDHPHARLTGAEHILGAGESPGPQRVDEEVVLELLVGARIVGQLRRRIALIHRDKPRTTPSRPHRRRQHGLHEQCHLVVEGDVSVVLAVLVDPHPQRPLLEPLLESAFRAHGVEDVAHRPRASAQFFDVRARSGLIDESLGGDAPRECGGLCIHAIDRRFAEPHPDRIVLRKAEGAVQQRGAQRRVPRRPWGSGRHFATTAWPRAVARAR
ncbi:hypothetical protein GCM10009808_09630 [Microbacterium sediminicola]|uniref:Uncharacterized protein n=1 Tax=Microbacterium sediminicola TaxID=415210 RepID=A0ABN2HW84_9MICO